MASSSEERDFSGVFDNDFDFSQLDLSDDEDWGSVDVAEKDDEEKVPKRTKRRDDALYHEAIQNTSIVNVTMLKNV